MTRIDATDDRTEQCDGLAEKLRITQAKLEMAQSRLADMELEVDAYCELMRDWASGNRRHISHRLRHYEYWIGAYIRSADKVKHPNRKHERLARAQRADSDLKKHLDKLAKRGHPAPVADENRVPFSALAR
jgi:predicted transcriptional regulator